MQPTAHLYKYRRPIALATWVGWVLLTLFDMRWANDGSPKQLLDTVTYGVSWNLGMALVLLVLPNFLYAAYLLRNVRNDTVLPV